MPFSLFKSSSLFVLLALFWHSMVYAQERPYTDTDLDKIQQYYDKVKDEGQIIQNLSEDDLSKLPIGISKHHNGKEYIIMIDSAQFTPQGATFNAYIILDFNQSGDRVLFGARNIGFHPGGLSQVTQTRLQLLSQHEIAISKKIDLVLPSNGRNYVEFDCNGFKSVNLSGVFVFDSTMIVPDKSEKGTSASNYLPQYGHKVQASFEVSTSDWGSLLATVNFAPFKIPHLDGLSFHVYDAVVDMSDVENIPNFQFPKDYFAEYPDVVETWEGFVIREVEVKLFDKLDKTSAKAKLTAQNLIIDKMGLSGSFGAARLFAMEEGSLGGWPFSIDSIGVTLVKNQLKGGSMKGELSAAFIDRETPLKYQALMYTNEENKMDWLFAIQPGDTLKSSVLKMQMELYPNSIFTIAVKDGAFVPDAILFGKASIDADKKLNARGLQFENFHINTQKPFVHSGVWALDPVDKSETKTGGFSLSLEALNIRYAQEKIELYVRGRINLMDKEDKGFSAAAGVSITGTFKEVSKIVNEQAITHHQWDHERTQLRDIEVNVNTGVFSIWGKLTYYERNKVYGEGFRGEVNFSVIEKFTVEAICQFGNVNDLKYWYVDASATLPKPKNPGFGFYAIGGGAYYHMIYKSPDVYARDITTITGNADALNVGQTRSGSTYVPDASIGLGILARVTVGTSPSPKAFNADATFEIAFNSTGGVRLIRIRGEGYFLTGLEERKKASVPMYADLNLVFDFQNRTFHANLDTYINVKNLVKGIHANGLAGSAVMHFAPDEWYIHIGTPEHRLGVNFVGIFEATAYFMVGSYILDMPSPPKEVSEILGDIDLDFMRQENELASGGGFAFGASLQVNTGRRTFLIFYGSFQAGAGFDIMLKDYGSAHCVGESEPIGMNGWYASGQVWAYLQGSIGIYVDRPWLQAEFEILRIGAAAVLQAKLPNPTWIQGVVGGRFSILGGLISGNCRFKVTIGKECEIEGASAVTGVKAIAELTPSEGSQEVSVFTAPQAVFNLPVNKSIELLDDAAGYKAYRVKLDYFKVKMADQEIEGELEWNDNNDVAIFKPFQVLPQESTLEAAVKVYWEEKVGSTWKAIGSDGELEKIKFTTGLRPKVIPEENVLFNYPVTNQFNFLKGEFPKGYVRLSFGQDYLFNDQEVFYYKALFINSGEDQNIEVPFSYEVSQVNFDIPQELRNNTIYQLFLVKTPKVFSSVDGNVRAESVSIFSNDSNTLETTEKSAEGSVLLSSDVQIYKTQFRTSSYNTFEEKMNNWVGRTTTGRIIPGSYIFEPGLSGMLSEVFDNVDMHGHREIQPLIQPSIMTNNEWYAGHIYPNIYQHYPIDNITINQWRREQPIGVPPLQAISFYQDIEAPKLSTQNVEMEAGWQGRVRFVYQLPYYSYMDRIELRNKIVDKYLNKALPGAASNLLSHPYSDITAGRYQIKLEYKLPGFDRPNSTKLIDIEW